MRRTGRTTRSGTSPGIPAARSWDRLMPVAPRVGSPHRAHRSPVARVRARGPKALGGAEAARAPLVARAAAAHRRPVVPAGRPARPARVRRSVGGGIRVLGRHRVRVARRQRAVVAGASLASVIRVGATAGSGARSPRRAAPAGPTTWAPTPHAVPWVVVQATRGRNHRRAPSRWPEGGRCATPTSGRPTVAAEPGTARVRCNPWVTPSMPRR